MEIKTFLREFNISLLRRGIPPEEAKRYTIDFYKRMPEKVRNKIALINNKSDVEKIAGGYIARISGNTGDTDIKIRKSQIISPEKTKSPDYEKSAYKINQKQSETLNSETKKINKVGIKHISKIQLTPEENTLFRKKMASNAIPLYLSVFFISLLYIIGFALIATLIIICLSVLVSITVAGSAAFLAGFIYGIIKLFSIVPEGIYELGLSLIIGGVTLALSILSYNLSVRAVPVLWKKLRTRADTSVYKLKAHINDIKRECIGK